MAINWHIGDVVRKLRELEGIKQGALARLADIRPATLSRIENSGKHDPETLKKIATALKVTVAEIHTFVPATPSTNTSGKPTQVFNCSKHANLLQHLDRLLDQPNGDRWVPVIEALLTSATREPGSGNPSSERQHGPVDTTRLPIPGVSNIEFKKPDARRKRN